MWIWYVSHSDGGDYQSIAARASANGIRTLFIKSGDGSMYWSQFNRALVDALHAQGIAACAWQFVYGNDPLGEAAVGAEAVRNGADCLVIDAEAAYEGRYTSAREYMDALRSDVGTDYPLGLSSFPYVDEHPDFPYSVFLGPGGANYNLPQMYWRDIGTSVPQVYAHTYADNVIYRRPIRPLGQVDLLCGRAGGSAVPRTVGRLQRRRPVLVGLRVELRAGDVAGGQRPVHARLRLHPRPANSQRRRHRRHGPVDAGAAPKRHPGPGARRQLRREHAREPPALSAAQRDTRHRSDRSADLARALAAARKHRLAGQAVVTWAIGAPQKAFAVTA